jgi:anhydro-N-acetylmuramic acid kinase
MSDSSLYIGLMSGTSMDGIDAALVDFSSATPSIVNTASLNWSPTLKEKLSTVAAGGFLSANQWGELDSEVGQVFADAAIEVSQGVKAIAAIGSHGQTVAHQPDGTNGFSVQLGNANIIAEKTGITTVADFRRRDIAAGGQGAPLVPPFHAAIFGDANKHRVIVNIGGIANITSLPTSGNNIIGFDTGPGNHLMDKWIALHQGVPFDPEGQWASTGTVITDLLEQLLSDNYFYQAAPKSTGTDIFSLNWLNQHSPNGATEDVMATLLELTAQSIAKGVQSLATPADEVFVCGGGVHNRALIDRLTDLFNAPVNSTAALGVDPDWVEAIAFAWLAKQTMEQQPGNLSSVTGASGQRILGAIYQA